MSTHVAEAVAYVYIMGNHSDSREEATMRHDDDDTIAALTIDQFCKQHNISRQMFYKLRKDNSGPREMRVGDRVLISKEAARDWRRERERVGTNEARNRSDSNCSSNG